MAGQILLRPLGGSDPEACEWALVSARGVLQGDAQRGTLAEAAAAARGRPLILVVSGSEASLTAVAVPGRNRRRALAAIPYALEEGLVEDVGSYHFVVAGLDSEQRYPVVVVLRSYLDRLLERLREYGIRPQRAVSEAQLLGASDDGWTVLVDGERAVVRLGPGRGFAIETDALPLLLEASRAELAADAGDVLLRVYGEREPLAGLSGYRIEWREAPGALQVLAQGLAQAPLNLLQQDYGRGTQVRRVLRHYRLSAALGLALLALLGAAAVLELRTLNAESESLRAATEAEFRKAFPEVRRVVNPRVQMEQRLRELRGRNDTSEGFLQLLASSAAALASVEEAQLNGLLYRRGRLELDIETSQLQTLDGVRQKIANGGKLTVSLESAKSEQDRVRGRLRVEPRAGTRP